MDSVIKKLVEIEETAEAIVEHAQQEKAEVEKEIQAGKDAFDRELKESTQNRLDTIRREGEEKMNRILENERKKNSSVIENLKLEFEENHTVYAKEILRRIIEV